MPMPWPLLPLLFAQNGAPAMPPHVSPPMGLLALPAVLVLAIPIVAIVMGVRNKQRKRELEHMERMRALELGRTWPGEASFWTPGHLAAGMGLGLPCFAIVSAFVASLSTSSWATGNIWFAAGLIGVAGIAAGTILTLRSPQNAPEPDFTKPGLDDPDTYDTTGQRGWNGTGSTHSSAPLS